MKNRVKEILNSRGFKRVQLTEEMLIKMGFDTPHRFNKIWHNQAEMTQTEMVALKNWLNLDTVDELLMSENERKKAK